MQLHCDVAVVGAGPAGSRTARNLARAGLSVRLLEEHRRVGVPSHCSGLISPRTLREAEIGEDAIIHRITGAFVHTAHGSEVALGGDKTRAVAIDRVRWDETLAEQAQVAGADLVRARLTGVERENSHVRLHTQTDGRDSTFTARVVVGADGAHSRVARSLGLPGPAEKVYCLGIEGRLKTPREEFVHVFVGHNLAPGWFGWLPCGAWRPATPPLLGWRLTSARGSANSAASPCAAFAADTWVWPSVRVRSSASSAPCAAKASSSSPPATAISITHRVCCSASPVRFRR